MSNKYEEFNNEYDEVLLYTQGSYSVYNAKPNVGVLYLVKNGKIISRKHQFTKGLPEVEYKKWIKHWEKNAYRQLDRIQSRIEDLQDDFNEINNML